jgi:hypothetical protein
MANRTDRLEQRARVLERVAHRVLLGIGAGGAMLAEVRHAEEGESRDGRQGT